jgi:membrane protein implicated in regulation of membrane protease activity
MSGIISSLLQSLSLTPSYQEDTNHFSSLLSSSGFELESWEREGIVVDTISPSGRGRVRAFATFWFARTKEPDMTLFPGDRVIVTARQGLLLFVELLEPTSSIRGSGRLGVISR